MKKILVTLLFFLFIPIIYSYENDYFILNVPEDYKETINDNIYSWQKDNVFINVVINENKDKYDINDFNDNDLKKQKDYIIDSYKNELSKYQLVPTINYIKVIKDNKISYLEYELFFDSKDTIGHNVYQKGRLYTSNNYVYTLTYDTENEFNDNDINILNSFKVKDTYLKNINYKVYIFLFILFGGLILLIDYLINKKRHS